MGHFASIALLVDPEWALVACAAARPSSEANHQLVLDGCQSWLAGSSCCLLEGFNAESDYHGLGLPVAVLAHREVPAITRYLLGGKHLAPSPSNIGSSLLLVPCVVAVGAAFLSSHLTVKNARKLQDREPTRDETSVAACLTAISQHGRDNRFFST